MSPLAPTLQLFVTERLIKQRQASPATIISYRRTFGLLLRFVQNRTGKAPSALDWADLNVEVISTFLEHLETERHNSARSRNTRLAALRHPEPLSSSRRCSRFPRSASTRPACRSCSPPKSMRCSPPRTGTAGRDGAITH